MPLPGHRRAAPGRRPDFPPMLVGAAGLAWRLLVVGVAGYALVWVLARLTFVVLPVFLALFLTALLHGPAAFLRRHGWPRVAASWVVLIGGLLVLSTVGYFVVSQIVAQYPTIVTQVSQLRAELRDLLDRLPGGAGSTTVDDLVGRVVDWLEQHRSAVAGGVLTAGRVAAEVVTGVILAVFLTFFFIADGSRLWSWTVRLLPATAQPSVNGAGHRAWRVLSGWVVGTAVIAAIHGVVIGAVLWLLGTPLVVPLAILVFLGSFIPVVGAVAFGGLAVLVTLVSVGLVPAMILVAVLVVENQLEAHLMQPFIVGRAVRLHPVAIVLVLAGGAALAGLFGAILAVPIVAALHAATKYLTGVEDLHGHPLRAVDRMAPLPPPVAAPLPFLNRRGRAAARRGGGAS